MNEINMFLDDVTYQTQQVFGGLASKKRIAAFREYLEDMVLFDIISCKRDRIELSSRGQDVPECIRYALIASGISRKGILPPGKSYIPSTIPVTKEHHYYAKQRVREIDFERLNGPYGNRVTYTIESIHQNPNGFPNISELIELGIAQNERECGYVEDYFETMDFCGGALFATWMIQRKVLENEGLSDTLAYDICEQIYARPQQKHYSLATAKALTKMAEIDLYVQQYGIESYDNYDEIKETLRNLEAAKITDPELMERYENYFKTMVKPKMVEAPTRTTKTSEKIKELRKNKLDFSDLIRGKK